jgi:hypothetical protein
MRGGRRVARRTIRLARLRVVPLAGRNTIAWAGRPSAMSLIINSVPHFGHAVGWYLVTCSAFVVMVGSNYGLDLHRRGFGPESTLRCD